MKLTRSKLALFGGFVLGLAILGVLILKSHNSAWKQVLGGNSISAQQGASSASGEGASEGGNTVSFGSLRTLLSGRMNSSDTGTAAGLLEEWLAALARKDGRENVISQQIIETLHSNPDGNASFYRRALQLLDDAAIETSSKQALIRIMDRAATPAAISLLAEWFRPDLPAELKNSTYRAIENIGQYYWGKDTLPQAAFVLRQLWMRSDDPNMLNAVGTALATIGGPDNISYLADAVLTGSRSIAEIEASSDPRVSAAWQSLQRMGAPEFIPLFQEKLQSSTSLLETSVYAGLLARMERPDSLQALLSWARGVGDEYAPAARSAFARIGSSASLQYIDSALAQNAAFKSSLVKAAILSTLKK